MLISVALGAWLSACVSGVADNPNLGAAGNAAGGSSAGGTTSNASKGGSSGTATSATGGTSPMAGNPGSGGTQAATSGGVPAATGGNANGAGMPAAAGAGGCAQGTSDCSGQCKNLMTDSANCGQCGMACAAGQTCVGGMCSCALECGGTCVDSKTDPANCGACGTSCGTGVCSAGACAASCAAHLTPCSGRCVDTTGSSEHCGGCGMACLSDQTCFNSACRCATGKAACGGTCIDVTMDTNNCGDCGVTCAMGQTCVAGVCTCPGSETVCNNQCRDTSSDPQNCGTCGTQCGGSTQCLYGGCIDPNSVNCGGSGQANNSCTRDAFITLGKYWVNNNQWGVSGGVNGQQCIWSTCQTGDLVGWGTSWNWSGGEANAVKSYVSLVFGWQWGWRVNDTGLPIQISSNKNVNCGWDFDVNESGTFNVAYDLFAHTVSNAGSTDDPTDEIMIWLYRAGGAGAIGGTEATVNLAGASWEVHRGNNGEWNVYSYVRTANATTSVLNVMEFMRDLVSRGWMSGSKYVSGVQAGTEVFSGTSQLDTHGFYCRVQ